MNNNNVNENNTNISRNNLSEMDKIFIPEDLDENIKLEDLVSYKFNLKGFKTVPENYSLVTKNVFTQINKNVGGFGVKFLVPFCTKTILVPKYSGIKKYTDVETFSVDGEQLKIDFDIVMRIVDPAKYMVEGKNKLNELDALVIRLLRIYVSSRKFQTILGGACDKADFDLIGELSDFKERYGIEIEKVLIEKVELSENLKKLYNDTLEEKQRRLAQSEKLAAEKEKAQNDADITKINYLVEVEKLKAIDEAKNDLYVDRISKLIVKLKQSGFTPESIDSYIKTMVIADSGNAIFMGNNLESQNIATGIAGAQMMTEKTKRKQKK